MTAQLYWKPSKKLEKMLSKYPEEANKGALKCVTDTYNVIQKEFTRINDGVSRRTKKSKPTKRTRWPGVRRPTGRLANSVKIFLMNRYGMMKVINSRFRLPKKKLFAGFGIGIDDSVKYAVYQERYGRQQRGLKAKNNYYPFVLPGWNKQKKRFSETMTRFMRKAERARR